MTRLPSVLASLLLLLPAAAHAWGADGHRIVCEIAWLELTPEVQAKVAALLPASGRYSRFSEACVWADNVRRNPSFPQYARDDERHFVNIEPGDTEVDMASRCPDTCAVEAIAVYAKALGGEPLAGRTRRDSLMFLSIYPMADGRYAGYGYYEHHRGEVAERLQQAGVRLAGELRKALQ